jgi:hypothetical protein
MFVANNEREKEAAIERNNQIHQRALSVSRALHQSGGSHILAYPHTVEQRRDSSLIGTRDEILAKLHTLTAAGVDYVMLKAAPQARAPACAASPARSCHVARQPGCVATTR